MDSYSGNRSEATMTGAIRYALLLFVLFAAASAAFAQSPANIVDFHIESQSLTQALREFARQAESQVLYDPGVVAGRNSPGLRGNDTRVVKHLGLGLACEFPERLRERL